MKTLFGVILGAIMTLLGLVWLNIDASDTAGTKDRQQSAGGNLSVNEQVDQIAVDQPSSVREDLHETAEQGTLLREKVRPEPMESDRSESTPGDSVDEYVAKKEAIIKATIDNYHAILNGRERQ